MKLKTTKHYWSHYKKKKSKQTSWPTQNLECRDMDWQKCWADLIASQLKLWKSPAFLFSALFAALTLYLVDWPNWGFAFCLLPFFVGRGVLSFILFNASEKSEWDSGRLLAFPRLFLSFLLLLSVPVTSWNPSLLHCMYCSSLLTLELHIGSSDFLTPTGRV